jgi:hypothetical protein
MIRINIQDIKIVVEEEVEVVGVVIIVTLVLVV